MLSRESARPGTSDRHRETAGSGVQRRLHLIALLAGTMLLLPPPADAQETPPRQISAVVHAHTSLSSGEPSPAELSVMARDAGIDVVVLTENFGFEIRYAPWPLRYLFEVTARNPIADSAGLGRYLREVARVQREHPAPLLLAGVEIPPYYYWTGSAWRGDLTLHDVQRNLLVVAPTGGVAGPQAFLEGLPIAGNPEYRRYGLRTLALLLPGLALVSFALSASGRARQHASTWLRLSLAAAGLALLSWNFPYSAPVLHSYDPEAGYAPSQRVLDYAEGGGALAFWSMPDVQDYSDRTIGPFRLALRTAPYPEALTATTGYTGFGGVYADTISTTDPGSVWDTALMEYLGGERAAPPWVIGESAFHFAGQAGKQLGDVLTVLLVDEPSHTGVHGALANGRSYAVRRDAGGPDLRLAGFEVSFAGGDDEASIETRSTAAGSTGTRPGVTVARAGETLEVAGDELSVHIRVHDAGGGSVPVSVELIRRGRLRRSWSEVTPFETRLLEKLDGNDDHTYYRLIVRGPRPAYIVSNPVFVQRAGSR